jgi:signal transduction histidine kinase
MVRVYVKDISEIVILQQRASDEMYKDSVLSNYSHEQLTPLNSFLNNSRTLLQDLTELSKDIQAKTNNIISTFD